jgi:hypothetical protein
LSPLLFPAKVRVRVPAKLPPKSIDPVFVKTIEALLSLRLWVLLP